MGFLFKRPGQPNWYVEYTDASGKRIRKSTKTRIRRDAEQVLKSLESKAFNLRHDLDSHDQKPSVLLDEYLATLADDTEQYRHEVRQQIERIFSALSISQLHHIDRYAVEECVRGFQSLTSKKTKRTISARSQAKYLTAIGGFTKWLTDDRRILSADPMRGSKKPTAEKNRVFRRRFLTKEEWAWLKKTPNALLYETAIQTGFRSNELRQLKPASLKRDHLLLAATHTKNRKQARQFITADLAKRLRGKLPFQLPAGYDVAKKLLYPDLAQARAAWLESKPKKRPDGFLEPINGEGERLDFHALRHTCGAWLAIANVPPKVIQRVMRHSTIVLTLDTYGHLLPDSESDAIKHFEGM